MLAWGASWMCKVPVITEEGSSGGAGGAASVTKRKRKQAGGGGDQNDEDEEDGGDSIGGKAVEEETRTSHTYRDLLLLDTLGPGELVVIERPFFDMLPNLPKAWVGKGKYGR
jgi:U3 small nucleolar RNA-associated protein 4